MSYRFIKVSRSFHSNWILIYFNKIKYSWVNKQQSPWQHQIPRTSLQQESQASFPAESINFHPQALLKLLNTPYQAVEQNNNCLPFTETTILKTKIFFLAEEGECEIYRHMAAGLPNE